MHTLKNEENTISKCVRCNRHTTDNYKTCKKCRDYSKKRREIKRKNNQCTACGVALYTNKSRCEICLCKANEQAIKKYYKNKKKNICTNCNKPVKSGKSLCYTCMKKKNKSRDENQKKGLCRCGSDIFAGKTCLKCRTYNKEFREKRKILGLCGACSNKTDNGYTLCSSCIAKISKKAKLKIRCNNVKLYRKATPAEAEKYGGKSDRYVIDQYCKYLGIRGDY